MFVRFAAGFVAVALVVTACSGDDDPSSASTNAATAPLTTPSTAPPSTSASESVSTEAGQIGPVSTEAGPSGPACPDDPPSEDEPATDAIARLPELSTLAEALEATQLADVLRGEGPFTVFAPVDAAFADAPDPVAEVVVMHVIDEQRLDAADLASAGTVPALGGDLSFTNEGGQLRVNGAAAVICADLQAANATIHLIDAVLVPPLDEEVSSGSQLYSVDLTTGAATSIGGIGDEVGVLGLAFDPAGGSTVYGLTDAPELISFDPADPATVTSVPITNVAEGSTLVAIDARAADGSLLAVSDASVLYAIDPATGEATSIGDGINPPLTDPGIGMDVDTPTDRVRLSSANGENLRVDPTTGTTEVDPAKEEPIVDTPFSQLEAPTPPRIVALANRQAPGGGTELFGIDAQAGALVLVPSPDVGVVRTVGSLGIDVTDGASLDIGPDGTALLVVPG